MNLPKGNQTTPISEMPKMSDRQRMISSTLGLSYVPGITVYQLEMYWIDQALKHFGGNKSKAAKSLGIGKSTLHKKLQTRLFKGL